MKTRIKFLLSLAILLLSFSVFSQLKYSAKVTAKWPYLCDDFNKGIVYYNNDRVSEALFNIDVANQTLIYVDDDDVIRQFNSKYTIDSLVMENTSFIQKENDLYEVIAKSGEVLLLKKTKIDLNSLNESEGGYGSSSSTSATTKLSSVYVTNYTGIAWEVVKLEKNKGEVLELIEGYYLAQKEESVLERATKKAFSEFYPDVDIKAIIKKHGLKLKDEHDLKLLFSICSNI